MNRDTYQDELVDRMLIAEKGLVKLPTGVGKTILGLKFLAKIPLSATILVPTKNLKASWSELTHHKVMLFGEAAKNPPSTDIIIIDEIHLCLTEIRRVLLTLPCKYLIGLTATWPNNNEYAEYLTNTLPLIEELSFDTAVEYGFVADIAIHKHKLELPISDRGKLYVYNKLVKTALYNVSSKDPFKGEVNKWSKQLGFATNKRKQFLWNHPKKIKLIQSLCCKDTIIFVKTKQYAEQLASIIPNSQAYYSGKDESILDDFKDDKFDVLIAVDSINIGFNKPSVKNIIIAAMDSSVATLIQRIGRGTRVTGKVCDVHLIYFTDTQEETWIAKALS